MNADRRAGHREAHAEATGQVLQERSVGGNDQPHQQEREPDGDDRGPGEGYVVGARASFDSAAPAWPDGTAPRAPAPEAAGRRSLASSPRSPRPARLPLSAWPEC